MADATRGSTSPGAAGRSGSSTASRAAILPPGAIPGHELLGLLHASGARAIYRARRLEDGEVVAIKTLAAKYPRKRDVAELRREHQILAELDLEGVVRAYELVAYGAGNLAISMELFGCSLADLLEARGRGPLSVGQLIELGIKVARILGQLHAAEVVHKDLVPRNILFDERRDELRLIDFGISSRLDRERQSASLSRRLEGSLPYISPEQTGRMNRDLDYRSDYYSLGVTLFELGTGSLPFEAADALEWVHRHISQPPPRAELRNPQLPPALGAIIGKLMAKNAEDRYQSSFGLIHDLERCRNGLGGDGTAFELGEADLSRVFRVPQALYGREAELERLGELFEDVAHGARAICLLSGTAGVGKSALANELSKAIVRSSGYLIQGKFDQFQQSTAYGAFALAFRGLVQQLLGEPRERLDAWRHALSEALGANAQLVVDLVPELELIIGPQPPVAELPPAEAQNRFQIVFLDFVRVFANADHPLVIFMDDLQWSDTPTLHLISRLVSARDLSHLLLLGAYRHNQIDPTHPLRLTLDELERTHTVMDLRLTPLDEAAVERFMADALRAPPQRVQQLSRIVHAKSRGNPFFINALVRSLAESGAIAFDPREGRWDWDEAKVREARLADNVVDFMVESLRQLPESTQEVLRLAACIGNRFDLHTLSVIHEHTRAQTGAGLHEALRRNMIVPLSDHYRLVGLDEAELPGGATAEVDVGSGPARANSSDSGDTGIRQAAADLSDDRVNPSYKFQHDRVQQAAYALIDEDKRQSVHLSIGRLIARHSSDEQLEERLIEVVGHLNAGRRLIEDPDERVRLARLNLRAGQKAQRSSAYASALGFLEIGRELLPTGDVAWAQDYELVHELVRELQQCAYLTGDQDAAEAWTERLLERVRTPLEKAEALSARTRQFATVGRMRDSIEAAIEGLRLLGIDVREDPDPATIEREIAAVQVHLAGREIASLIDAPALEDPTQRIAIRLLMEIFPAAFLSGSGALFPYLVLKSVNISLAYGTGPESAFAYAAYGMLLCGALEDPALGFEYGQLAVAMNERLDDIALKSRVIYVYAMFIHHWSRHWSTMTPWFLKGIESGYASGDLLYLAYSAQDCIIWDPTLDLERAAREQRKYLEIVADCEYKDSYDSGTLFLQMQRNFLGLTKGRYSLDDDDFDEAAVVEGMLARRFMTGIANFHIYKAEIHYFYEDFEGAWEHVLAQEELIASSMSLPQLVRFELVAFLTRSARSDGSAEDTESWRRMRLGAERMEAWASHCPENFEHLAAMMRGEFARLEGRLEEALAGFEAAIEGARSGGWRRDEAMANELAGRALFQVGLAKAAEGYLRAAQYLYYRWGAKRKVEQLHERYPTLLPEQPEAKTGPGTTFTYGTATTGLDAASLDMNSVMKASQAISGEMVLEQLWRTTLAILLENAGGQSGAFIVRRDGELVVQARSGEVGDASERDFPASIVNHALRSGDPLVLEDARDAGRFSSDPYVLAKGPRSVLCVPIRRHTQFEACVYLENNLVTGAFTRGRVEVINLLSSQAAISMDNAKLYEEQLRLTEAQRRFVPSQFLENLGHHDIARVDLGQYVARKMSVMFADLRDFTPLAERLGPRAMIELLNDYFSRLGEPIAEAGGFIDSYNGDEIMALFGVSADRAVRAGVGMARALAAFNADSPYPPLRMGVGVNTGELVLGTVGSPDRLKCGVVGDTVNLASRIEQLTKTYQAAFLIGEQTHASLEAPEQLSLRRVDRVAVKGKAKAVDLFEVLDAELPERKERKERTREHLLEGQRRYYARDFSGAVEAFEAGQARDPDDPVFKRYLRRARAYAATPPPKDWGGFESLDHK